MKSRRQSRCHDCPLRRRRGTNEGVCSMCERSTMSDKELKEEQARLEKLFGRNRKGAK